MCVQVDEAGKQDSVREVEGTIRGGRIHFGGACLSDDSDPVVADCDMSGAVDAGPRADDATSADDQVEIRVGWLHHGSLGVGKRRAEDRNAWRLSLHVVSTSLTLTTQQPLALQHSC